MEQQNTTGQPEQTPVQPMEAQKADISNDAKNLGMLCHLLGFFTSFVGPLILWLIKKARDYPFYNGLKNCWAFKRFNRAHIWNPSNNR